MTRLLRSALTLLFAVAPLGAQQASSVPTAPPVAADLQAEIRGESIERGMGMSSLVAGRIALTIGESRVLRVAPGQKLELPLRIDPASAGANVASLTTGITWDATRLTLDSVLSSGVGSLTPNTSNAASGSLALSWLNPTGSTSQVTVARLFFTASATSGGTTLLMAPSALGSESAGNLLAQAVARQTQACVVPPGNWGDVNGDGNVNIIDAQQIARYSVSLDVARPELVTSQGDVSADEAVNILDAQQIARSAVGLSAAARIGQAAFTQPTIASVLVLPATATLGIGEVRQFAASPRAAGDVAWDGCVATSWSSSSAAATVDTTGIVSGVSDGDVTITATAGGVQGTSAVTVGAGAGTGIRLLIDSPVAASRYVVYVEGSGMTAVLERRDLAFAKQGTIDIELPVGTGRTVYVMAGDSGAVNPDAAVSVSAGIRFNNVEIVDGQRTVLEATLQPMGIATTYPTSVAQGSPYALTSVLTDPTGIWYGLATSLGLYRSNAPFTVDRGASAVFFAGVTTLNATQKQFTGEPFRPTATGTIYAQVSSRITFNGGTYAIDLTDRALVRGEDLAQTTVTAATTGFQLNLTTSALGVDRFLVGVDTVGGAVAWGTLSGTDITGGTVTVPVPAGGNYRVRIAALDEQFFTPVTNATYSEIKAGKQLLAQTVNPGEFTVLDVTLDVATANAGIPANGTSDVATAFTGNFVNPSHFIPNACVYRWSTAGPIAFDNLGTLSAGGTCVISNRQPSGAFAVSGTLPVVSGPATIHTQFFTSFLAYGPTGDRYELAQTQYTSTAIAAPAAAGLRLNITSPVSAPRYWAYVTNGGLATPVLVKVSSNFSRNATIVVPLPAGTGYRVRVLAADSLSLDPDATPLLAAGLELPSVDVADGVVQTIDVTLQDVTVDFDIATTGSVGSPLTATVTLTDPSALLEPIATWANVYVRTSAPDFDRQGASVQLTNITDPVGPTKSFTGVVTSPTAEGEFHTQSGFGVTLMGTTTFWALAPSLQRGEAAVVTTVTTPATLATLNLNVTAPEAVNHYIAIVDQGPGTPAMLKQVSVTPTATQTVSVPVAAGGTYRVRAAALDSVAFLQPTRYSAELRASALIESVVIADGQTLDVDLSLVNVSSALQLPTTATVGLAIAYSGTARDPGRVQEGEVCVARWTDSGPLYGAGGFGSTAGSVCNVSSREADGTRTLAGAMAPPTQPATRSWQVIMSRAYALPNGVTMESNQFSGAVVSTVISAAPPTAIRLAITSPVGAKRYYAYVSGGALAEGQLVKLQSNFRRTETMLLPVPAGSGYRVQVLAVDSLALLPDTDALVAAGGDVANIAVTDGQVVDVPVTLEPVVVDVDVPTSATAGVAFPVSVTLTDPSRTIASLASWSIAYANWSSWTTDRASPSTLIDSLETIEADRVVRFVGGFAPAQAGTLYSQFGFGLTVSGVTFRMIGPSLQRGEPLHQTVVAPSTSTLEVTVNSPVPVNQFIVSVDTGQGGVPVVAELRGSAMTSGVVSLPVPVGTGYRIRAAAADSVFNQSQSRFLALLRAGAVLDNVDVPVNGVNAAEITLVEASRSMSVTPSTTVGNDIVVTGTFTDPSRLTAEDGVCAVRYNDVGQIPDNGLGVLQNTCSVTNLQPNGTFNFDGTISGRLEPGTRWWLVLMNSNYLLPSGRTVELDNSVRGSTTFTTP